MKAMKIILEVGNERLYFESISLFMKNKSSGVEYQL